jgi:putative redox protein
MKATLNWKDGMTFNANIRDHAFVLDSPDPGGKDRGPSPKETLIASILGCTGIDVVAHLKKHRFEIKRFALTGNAESRTSYPKIFSQIDLVFDLEVALSAAKSELPRVLEAVELSMTKYCSVSAMVAPTSPIFYTVLVNGEIEGRGQANFPAEPASKS